MKLIVTTTNSNPSATVNVILTALLWTYKEQEIEDMNLNRQIRLIHQLEKHRPASSRILIPS